MDGESLQRLLNILQAGKDLFSQIQRNLFVSDTGIAETLCRRSQEFIETLYLFYGKMYGHNLSLIMLSV
jgi:hypothetical protein